MLHKVRYKVEFPCGYKFDFYQEMRTLTGDYQFEPKDDAMLCPLHGKDCKRG